MQERVKRNKPPQAKFFAQQNKLDVERCSIETIRYYTCNVKELIKKVENSEKITLEDFLNLRTYL